MQVFMQRFLRAAIDATTIEYSYLEQHARYVLELTLLDYECLRFRPSTLAAAAILFSRAVLAGQNWTNGNVQWCPHVLWNRTMQHYTFHSAAALQPCVQHLCKLVSHDQDQSKSAVFRKYKVEKRKAVSLIPCPEQFDGRIFQPNHAMAVPQDWVTVPQQ
jgi:cyclin-A